MFPRSCDAGAGTCSASLDGRGPEQKAVAFLDFRVVDGVAILELVTVGIVQSERVRSRQVTECRNRLLQDAADQLVLRDLKRLRKSIVDHLDLERFVAAATMLIVGATALARV